VGGDRVPRRAPARVAGSLEHRVGDREPARAAPQQLERVALGRGDGQLGEPVGDRGLPRQQPGDERDPGLAEPQAAGGAELGPPAVALERLAGQPRVVVPGLVQPRPREVVERPQHAGGAEVDAVQRIGRLPVVVERVQRPPLAVAQRPVRVAGDRPDRRLRGGRAPCGVPQRLVGGRVEQHAGDASGAGRANACSL
jgi:hypothetical protein